MINRPTYLKSLKSLKDKKLIKVVTGIRRSGKSTLLELFQNFLLSNGIDKSQIISVNFEDMEFDELRDTNKFYRYVTSRLNPEKMNYIFLDEIQHLPNFEKPIDSLFIKKNVDLYLTGSNATLLSGELATLLSGRYVEIQMLPLSFSEYASSQNEAYLPQLYKDYLSYSSFPYATELNKNQKIIDDYLHGIYSSVILKDVMTRNNFSSVSTLERIVRYLFDNIGNLTSIKKISDTLCSDGIKVSQPTVENYVRALVDAFIIYPANRYDIKGKTYLKSGVKYYVTDIALRTMLLGRKNIDWGHVLENVIFLELKHRGYDVYVGKTLQKEIDFVAITPDAQIYYQVSASIRDPETRERELSPLRSVKDNYEKVILTLDDDPPTSYEGIKTMNALSFLSGNSAR